MICYHLLTKGFCLNTNCYDKFANTVNFPQVKVPFLVIELVIDPCDALGDIRDYFLERTLEFNEFK